jgi:hypothetical protein
LVYDNSDISILCEKKKLLYNNNNIKGIIIIIMDYSPGRGKTCNKYKEKFQVDK